MFGWFRASRRRRLANAEMPKRWTEVLEEIWQYSELDRLQRQRLDAWVRIFINERRWEGCDGLKLNEEMKVLVAGQAGLLVLGHDQWYFDHTPSILIYPQEYTARDVPRSTGGGFTIVGDEDRSGEAWYRGPIILSLPGVIAGAQSPNHGHNLVVHEFAHHLDMIGDRYADGKPPMPNAELDQLWDEMVPAEFEKLRRQCSAGFRPLLSCYGATNMAEFFCVASETFFQLPQSMHQQMPSLYEVFKQFYRLDPIKWTGQNSY